MVMGRMVKMRRMKTKEITLDEAMKGLERTIKGYKRMISLIEGAGRYDGSEKQEDGLRRT